MFVLDLLLNLEFLEISKRDSLSERVVNNIFVIASIINLAISMDIRELMKRERTVFKNNLKKYLCDQSKFDASLTLVGQKVKFN